MEEPVFGAKSVAARLDSVLKGEGSNDDIAAELKERTGYVVSGEKIRKARKGENQTIAHDLLAAVAITYGVGIGWLLMEQGPKKPAPNGERVSFEPIGEAERLEILRLLSFVQHIISTGPASFADLMADLRALGAAVGIEGLAVGNGGGGQTGKHATDE